VVLSPGLFSGLGPARANPGKTIPLRASEIVEALGESVMSTLGGKPVNGKTLVITARRELRDIILLQAAMRGIWPGPEFTPAVTMSLDGQGKFEVQCEPDWEKSLNLYLLNRDCRRCGGLITAGFDHTQDDCDLRLAEVVINT
jgi:hypothetical protein